MSRKLPVHYVLPKDMPKKPGAPGPKPTSVCGSYNPTVYTSDHTKATCGRCSQVIVENL